MSDLRPGSRLGPYEIASSIGAGGMGEVYKGRDERLERAVAIKILPRAYVTDPERVARFHREAKALAALNHPNIAGIHGVEPWNGTMALVMEFVEGEDLALRTGRGAMPMDEALVVALQIADGLAAAHQQGIIHRDLKPANIKVRPDGTVKILDFGLAKVLDPAGAAPQSALDATVTSGDLTNAGSLLGTAAYMSPEQARGRPLDRRTDIWAFGCVLFEMLTGRRAFHGDHPSDVVARVLTGEPEFAALPADTPAAVRRLLRRCLRKDPSDRLHDMGDARLEIRDAQARVNDPDAAGVTRARARTGARLAWLAVAILAAAAALVVRPRSVPPEMRVEIVTPETASPLSFALSPDGTTLAFTVSSETDTRLWLRSLHSGALRELPGTEGAGAPFWSPDGRSIAFFADGRLRRVDLDGGSVQTLANATTGTNGTWGREDVILFASRGNPISRVSARERGEPSVVGGLAKGSNFSPSFLPDGRKFLYYHRGSPEVRGVYLGDLLEPGGTRRLFDSETGAVYSPTGHLLYILQGTLFARPFEVQRLQVSGEPFEIAGSIVGRFGELDAPVSVSNTGSLAYRPGARGGHRQLIWFDRSGTEVGPLGDPGETFSLPSLSPDGEHVLFYRGPAGNVDLWTMDTKRGAPRRRTDHPGDDVSPVWSPDGKRVAFTSSRSGGLQLYAMTLTDGREELLLETPAFKMPSDWSVDGRFLLFTTEDTRRSLDIWALPLKGDRTPFPVVRSAEFAEQGAQFSPDGKWIAYQSDRSGRGEIYLRAFPGPGDDIPISTTGGSQVRWRRDSTELFYVARNGDLMVVRVHLPSNGGQPTIDPPKKLFTPPLGRAMQFGDARHQYTVSADGQRFLVGAVTPPPLTPISLILNWKVRP